MKILFFGDVFGRSGRNALKSVIPAWREKYGADAVIVNAENIAHGNGITKSTLQELKDLNIDMFTSGDHIWDDPEAKTMLAQDDWRLLRPENFPAGAPGTGHKVTMVGAKKLLVMNILGRSFMRAEVDSPFRAAESVLAKYTLSHDDPDKERMDAIFVDFHAETTSEKRALGFLLDGRVSAIVGTHTHVPTADAQVLSKGTGYLSDSGMVGPFPSVIGLEPAVIIERFLTQMPVPKQVAETGQAEVGCALVEIGDNGLALKVEQLRKIVPVDISMGDSA